MNDEREKKPITLTDGEPRMSTYLNTKGVRLGLPVSGTFELTARCNFDCKMCYVHRQDAAALIPRELTADQWLSIASDARDAGLMFLLLTGGEPFIRQDFPYLWRELQKFGFKISVNTNASLYNDELRALFREYRPTRINVSLYGGSEETYRRLCGRASYETVVRNLRSMKQDDLPVRLNLSLTPFNVDDAQAVDAISREIGLQINAAAYMYPPVRVTGRTGENAGRFEPEQAGKVLARWAYLRDGAERTMQRAALIREKKAAAMANHCADPEQEGVLCRAGRSAFWMTWDGRMLPCGTMDVEASYPLEVGFKAAWDEVRARTAAIRLPAECTSCPDRRNCSVCASICKGETGRFDGKPEYVCRMTESMCRETAAIADELSQSGKSEQ